MKIIGQLFIALMGGIIAIILYRSLENDGRDDRAGNTATGIFGRSTGSSSGAADSINNVFNVGFGDAAETTLAQVVHIRARIISQVPRDPFYEHFGDGFWGPRYRNPQQQVQEASGSGVIVSSDGHIVTNNHVVGQASEIVVSLYNGRGYKAEIIGTDPSTDLAVIKIDEKDLPKAVLANSDDVRVGDWVLAVGNPFNLASTVTAGIVSAKARNINILTDNSAIESFIQTDAAVNPGNSGGALVNLKGELVGINTAIATPTGTYAGYSFAVPSNIVNKVMTDLIEYGEVQRGYLGVVIQDLSWQLAEQLGLDVSQGVVIANLVRGGPADKAGLEIKDVILEMDGNPINSSSRLLEIVGSHKPGDELDVVVQRNGRKTNVSVRLAGARSLQSGS
ncbi:MAG TPA: trypsin-like peptidase domain-containing protein [Chryseosolibacter sp.]|nr:trypsin-like peptidase domain-containing protein [Chryseosolibacter sp.]